MNFFSKYHDWNSVAIVIPMYNEHDSMPILTYRMRCVLRVLTEYMDPIHFIAVDDGSTDDCILVLEENFKEYEHFHMLRMPSNQGYSAALRVGIDHALTLGVELIVTIDADTNYDHMMIPLFINSFPHDKDIMTASPWHPDGQRKFFPAHRLFLSVGLSSLYNWALRDYGQPIYTYTACFRVAKSEVYEKIRWEGKSFMANAEIMTRCIINGYRVKEVATPVNPRWFGQSKMRILRQMLYHLKFLWKFSRKPEVLHV